MLLLLSAPLGPQLKLLTSDLFPGCDGAPQPGVGAHGEDEEVNAGIRGNSYNILDILDSSNPRLATLQVREEGDRARLPKPSAILAEAVGPVRRVAVARGAVRTEAKLLVR